MKTAILIPARLESTRLPDKMLIELDGVPLIRKVYDACVKSGLDTYVVTDSLEIAEIVPNFVEQSVDGQVLVELYHQLVRLYDER